MTHYFFDLPLESIHRQAFGAAVAASCARQQGQFWEMHAKLFKNQRALAEENLQSYASELNLDMEAFNQCLKEEDISTQVRSDIATAARIGARGTPNFWIGLRDAKDPSQAKLLRNLRGAKGLNDFKAVFESLESEEKN